MPYVHDEFLSNTSIFTLVDELWDNFKSICMKCLDLVPTKQVNTNSNRNGLTVILNVYLARNKDTTMELVFPNYRVAGTIHNQPQEKSDILNKFLLPCSHKMTPLHLK